MVAISEFSVPTVGAGCKKIAEMTSCTRTWGWAPAIPLIRAQCSIAADNKVRAVDLLGSPSAPPEDGGGDDKEEWNQSDTGALRNRDSSGLRIRRRTGRTLRSHQETSDPSPNLLIMVRNLPLLSALRKC